MSVFYERFERHSHGEGLKARSTHYCPGCGHGLVHGYLADAIEALGVQDRTVAISPVGCSVFLYYYLDVGNTQAAHGRAPAVALGHKLANPNAVVISYQGDGDLASIGLAEIVHAAQTGIPISVVFVNNAIYGMTGGQMAPTTLMGQKTATSPAGRERLMGEPLRMAELIAQIEGPVYVERVALFDNKQRLRAKKALRKALECQVQGRGFAFVEVLAECPLHLGKTPLEAEAWVKECMLPVFPLGVKKDVAREPWPEWQQPSFDAQRVSDTVGARPLAEARPAAGAVAAKGLALKLAGAGGDGAQTAALLLASAAIEQGLDATHIPSYGPESRGGTSYADVRIEPGEVLSPAVPVPDVLVAFNAPSVARFLPTLRAGGTLVYDSSVVSELPEAPAGARCVGVPAARIAEELGRRMVKNVVILGALQEATGLLPAESLMQALRQALAGKPAALIELNERAFRAGAQAAAQCLAEEAACSPRT